jgi:hypothetical protein
MAPEEQDISLIVRALTCPITLELFIDPVLASDGHTYERSAIIEWIKHHHGTSPMTRQTVKIQELKPNRIVKQLADQYRSSITSNVSKEITTFSSNGTLLNEEQKLNINRLFTKDQKWLLIYKATIDGFRADDFHRLCDNRSSTLTFIQTRHRFHRKKHHSIFGGYTTIPWTSRYDYYSDSQAFLFLLAENQVTRFNLRSSNGIAVSHNRDSGPIFGTNDIHICHRANENHSSFSRFPSSYQDLYGQGRKTFSKGKHFLVNEIEVYMMVVM